MTPYIKSFRPNMEESDTQDDDDDDRPHLMDRQLKHNISIMEVQLRP